MINLPVLPFPFSQWNHVVHLDYLHIRAQICPRPKNWLILSASFCVFIKWIPLQTLHLLSKFPLHLSQCLWDITTCIFMETSPLSQSFMTRSRLGGWSLLCCTVVPLGSLAPARPFVSVQGWSSCILCCTSSSSFVFCSHFGRTCPQLPAWQMQRRSMFWNYECLKMPVVCPKRTLLPHFRAIWYI